MHMGRIQAKRGLVGGKCDLFQTGNSLWFWGQAQPQENFAIYTFIYVWKQYFQLLTDTKLLPMAPPLLRYML